MELIKTPYRIRCEMGVCKNVASRTVMLSRCGVKSRIHMCEDCMKELHSLISKDLAGEEKTQSDPLQSDSTQPNTNVSKTPNTKVSKTQRKRKNAE